MKILKNKIMQIAMISLIIVSAGFIVYFSTRPVLADDVVTMKYVNDKIGELQSQLNGMNEKIILLEETNATLENNLKTSNEKVASLEKQINSITTRTTKIETRENLLYDKVIEYTIGGPVNNAFSYIKKYKQNN